MQPYKQSTKFTCSVTSLMNLINFFDKDIKLKRDTELEFWQKAVILPTKRSSIFAMASIAKEHNIPVKLIVENTAFIFPEYRFKKYRKFEVELAEANEKRLLDKTKDEGIKMEERVITLDEIKELLKNKKILVRLNIGILRNTKANRKSAHYIAITGYKNNKFTIIDSRQGKKDIKEEIMKEAFESVKEQCKRDHRMLILG